ncbi:MAG: hypothetical protein Q8P92_03755 [Candidatus Daviesbacteria bacterium]|nr:hypothetical protein [Candidatus Daviesbacteria bacterium]
MRVKILLLFFVFSFFFKTDTAFDQDLGRHIKLGEIIVQTGQIPKTNLFSYTNPDFPFINTHWLFGVIAYGFSKTIGLQAFLVLKIIIILLSLWLILKIVPPQNYVLLLPIGFIFLHVLRERTALRPEIFSFLFTALTFYILEKRKTKLFFLLPIIQLIWINTHIYFFVGLMLQTIFLVVKRQKLPAIILGFSLVLSLINPNGISGLLYPLNVTKNYGYTIVENQTLFFLENINFQDPNFIFVKISAVIVGISLFISFIRKQFVIKNILLASAGVGLALMHVRSFPYLVFLSLPAVLQNIGPIRKSILTTMIATVFTILALYESFSYLKESPGLKMAENGKNALDFVINNNLPNPIFNNFDIGSYIIYRGYPKYRVFVDGRPEAYPADFFTNTYIPMQSDYARFKKEEQKWGFKTIVFSHTDQTPWGRNFLQNVVKDPSWETAYIDNFMVVLVKKGVN